MRRERGRILAIVTENAELNRTVADEMQEGYKGAIGS